MKQYRRDFTGTTSDAVIVASERETNHIYAGTATEPGKHIYAAVLHGVIKAVTRHESAFLQTLLASAEAKGCLYRLLGKPVDDEEISRFYEELHAKSEKHFTPAQWEILNEISGYCRQDTIKRTPVLYTYSHESGWIEGEPNLYSQP